MKPLSKDIKENKDAYLHQEYCPAVPKCSQNVERKWCFSTVLAKLLQNKPRFIRICYRLDVCIPPKSIFWNFSPQCDNIWRWGLWEVIGFGWGLGCGALWWDWCPNKGMKRPELSVLCEDTGRKKPSANQEEGPHQEPNWLAPWSWTFQPPEVWEINVCCLSYSLWFLL